MNEMGRRIRQKRTELNMTMEQLASALGIQASAVNKYEKGLVENIKRSTIQEMSKIFNCDPSWLMGFDDKKEKVPTYAPEIQELVDILPKLTTQQRELLLQTARQFLNQNDDK